jgi:hypothetical protein
VLAPYRNVPFRTTHQLQIIAPDSTIEIFAIYSPDDNIIERNSFTPVGDVEIYDEAGFRLLPEGEISYTRSQTGGLTLSFIPNPGKVTLNWDGTAHTFDLESIAIGETYHKNGWSASFDADAERIMVQVPGYTWGEPRPFWLLLGILLPIADFITLTSLFIALIWFMFFIHQKNIAFQENKRIIKIWLEALVSIFIATLLIHVGFPDFLPFWFLLFMIPTVIYLAYHQGHFLIRSEALREQGFKRIKTAIQKIAAMYNKFNHSRLTFWILMLMIAIIGGAVQLHLTADGMGLSGDSVHYMDGARNMAAGAGYVRHIAEGEPVVMTGFPPVYPAMLVPSFWLGIDVLEYARFFNTLLFALTLILTGWIVYKSTYKILPAVLVDLFLLMSPVILRIYAWVMSEPLFIVLLLVVVLLWFWYVKYPKIWKVILAGLACGIMLNTRLAGTAFLPPIAIGMFIFQNVKFKIQLRDTLLFMAAALLQPAAFFIRNSILTETISESRGLTLAPFQREYWEIIGTEVASWFNWDAYFTFQYQQYNAMFATLGIIFLLTLGWIIFRKTFGRKKSDPIIILLLISIPFYISLIVLNTILLTPSQTISGLARYMIPVLVLLFILLGKILNDYWERPILLPKLMILFIILVASQLYFEDFSQLYERQPFGFREYTDRKNLCGEELNSVIDTIEEAGNISFYTNNCEYLYHMTNRRCRHLPLEETAYLPDGEVFQAVMSGDVIAFVRGFGTDPPGIENLLADIDHFDSACYFQFYRRLPEDE